MAYLFSFCKIKTLNLIKLKESATVESLIDDDKKLKDNEGGLTGPQSPPELEINAKRVESRGVKKSKAASPDRRHSNKADSNRMANLKTAAMLFVVNLVFVITFMPAFLMAIKLVPYNEIVFYLYFANNVANPVIYSFMNKNFRADLIKLFKSSSH